MKPADEALELTRMLAEERGELAAPVALLRERGPDAAELASLASRLALQGIDVTPKSQPSAPQSWKKWSILGGGGAAVVLAWLAWRAPQAEPVAAKAAVTTGPRDEAHARAAPGTPTSTHASSLPLATRDFPISPAAAASAAPLEAANPSSASTLASVPHPPADVASPLPLQPKPTVSAAAVPHSEVEQRVGGQRATGAPTSASSAGSGSDSRALPTEIELLRDARLALRQSPAASLSLTEQHARLYPQGKLVQERELIAISALVALGRRTAALSRGARFDAAYPTSPYRKQIDALLQ